MSLFLFTTEGSNKVSCSPENELSVFKVSLNVIMKSEIYVEMKE